MDFSKITTLNLVDLNTITGQLHGRPVKVFRRAKGWSVNLCVEVDGLLVHEAPPDATDCAQYAELLNRADLDAARARDSKRRDVQDFSQRFIFYPQK